MKFIFKLFGWLFSNLFLILVVVALCYAYVYWDDPFGKDTPVGKVMAEFPDEVATAKNFVADVTGMKFAQGHNTAKTEASSSQQVTASTVTASSGVEPAAAQSETDQTGNDTDKEDAQAVVAQSQVLSEPQPAGDADAANAAAVVSADVAAMDATATDQASNSPARKVAAVEFAPAAEFPDEGVAPAAPAEDETAQATKALVGDVFVPPEIEDALNQLHNDGSEEDVAVMQQVDKPARQLIIDARKAFYRRDYAASIAAYKQLIANEKDNFDALGELGNVYFTQGNMELAAEAYYQAATIMVDKGQGQRAASLIGFLATVDAEKAKKLGEMLVSDEQQDAL